MDEWHFIAARKTREALEEGAVDRLEGAGKPLNLARRVDLLNRRIAMYNLKAPVSGAHKPPLEHSG
jgi:hypothetical protein